jgi:methionyl-tRNA formyltransferase
MAPFRIVFMGTPDFAVPTLRAVLDGGHEVACVYTQPPRAAGRGMALRKSPVQLQAEQAGVPVNTPERLRGAEEQERFRALNADAAVVVAYGLILPKVILDTPRFGCLNLHASLLPHWRGAAPINRAIMAGDRETGASIIRMDEGLDTGPVCLETKVAIGPEETAGELHDRLAALGASLMVSALEKLKQGSLSCRPQHEGATYAPKLDAKETRINWRLLARDVNDRIRGLSPYPGAWFEIELNGKRERIKVLRSAFAAGAGMPGMILDDHRLTVACGEGAVRLTEVQRAGKRPMNAEDFLRGVTLRPGTVLG